MRWPGVGYLFLASMAVSACTPANWAPPVSNSEVERVNTSEGFTHDSLWKDKMVFGGVTSLPETWGAEKNIELSRAAVLELESIKRLVRLNSVDYFVEHAGEDAFSACNQAFQRDGELDEEALRAIAGQMPDIRYIFFTRIVSDESRSWESTTPQYEDGKIEEYHISHYAERKALAEGKVYDLQSKEMVWSARVYSQLSRAHETEDHADDSFKEGLIESLLDGGMPDPPSDRELIDDIHSLFSKQLPKAGACSSNDDDWLECTKLKQAMRVEWNETSQTALSKVGTPVIDNNSAD